MGNVVVKIETMSTEGKSSFPSDVNFWTNLLDNYTNEFQEVVIQCWNEEEHAINELSSRAASTTNEGLIKIFYINLNEENRVFLRNHSVDPNGGLKWFTMFFNVNGDERLEVSHYGSEIILYKADEEIAKQFISIFSSSITTHYYDENAD
ncbi:hypothetical protein PB01_13480 [Psychrobacillus glaciei]|uniref:Uncharacterized protein n=1 Tax=Psychrobacillus glaciei TaxID=2283160 RepID=A0A5J6SNY1_9BACI|nr:hypothetical protein [Psychrobacillus glaciei]QFF99770.1 hypothetical protein PB01_13480 [Psychrobacillus glaciei]